MAITATNRINFDNSFNSSVYSATWPSAPTTDLLYIMDFGTSGTYRTVTAITDGTGLSWVAMTDTGVFDGSYRLSRFYAKGPASPAASVTRVTLGGAVSRGHIVITEFDGISIATVTDAVLQWARTVTAASPTAATATLGSAVTAGNATFGALCKPGTTDTSVSPGGGGSYIELTDKHITLPTSENQVIQTQFNATANQDCPWAFVKQNMGGLVTEIVAAAGGGGGAVVVAVRPFTIGLQEPHMLGVFGTTPRTSPRSLVGRSVKGI